MIYLRRSCDKSRVWLLPCVEPKVMMDATRCYVNTSIDSALLLLLLLYNHKLIIIILNYSINNNNNNNRE